MCATFKKLEIICFFHAWPLPGQSKSISTTKLCSAQAGGIGMLCRQYWPGLGRYCGANQRRGLSALIWGTRPHFGWGPSPTARRSDYTTFQAKIRKAVTTEVITTIIDKEPGNQNTGRPCQGSSLYNVYQLCEPISWPWKQTALSYWQLMKGGDAFWVPYLILKHQSLPCSEHKTDTFKETRPNLWSGLLRLMRPSP